MDKSGFDMNFGGDYFHNANAFWDANQGDKPDSNVNDIILKLEKSRIAKRQDSIVNDISELYDAESPDSSIPPPPPQPGPPPPGPSAAPVPVPQREQIRYINNPYPVYTYNPLSYRRLYDRWIDYIPSYYTYEERTRLKEMLDGFIKSKLSEQKSEHELEGLIKKMIDAHTVKPVKKAIKKTSKKPKSKKSKKTSKKSKSKKSKK